MPIVGGLDIHRKQITFDYVDTDTGELQRGQVAPADRTHLAGWLARRFAGRHDVEFALEGCTGWRYVAEELAAAGAVAHVGEPADTAALRGRKRHAKTDRTDSRHLRQLLADGRLPECWIPPSHVLECRALLELYRDLRVEHTAWTQRIHAVLFHQGARQLGGGGLRTEQGLAEVRAVATALDMLAALDEHLDAVHRQLLHAARHLTGARVLAARLYGVGPITALALTCWLAGAGQVLLGAQGGPVHRPGRHRVLLGRQTRAGAPVEAGTGGVALVRVRGRQDPRPGLGAGPRLLRAGQGAHRRQTRRDLRGPQDRSAGLPHPRRARRRGAHRGLIGDPPVATAVNTYPGKRTAPPSPDGEPAASSRQPAVSPHRPCRAPEAITAMADILLAIRNAYEHIEDRALGTSVRQARPRSPHDLRPRHTAPRGHHRLRGDRLTLDGDLPLLLAETRQFLKDAARSRACSGEG